MRNFESSTTRKRSYYWCSSWTRFIPASSHQYIRDPGLHVCGPSGFTYTDISPMVLLCSSLASVCQHRDGGLDQRYNPPSVPSSILTELIEETVLLSYTAKTSMFEPLSFLRLYSININYDARSLRGHTERTRTRR